MCVSAYRISCLFIYIFEGKKKVDEKCGSLMVDIANVYAIKRVFDGLTRTFLPLSLRSQIILSIGRRKPVALQTSITCQLWHMYTN